MRLADPELIDRLAQRYVIGTQCGAARRRFANLSAARFDVRDRIDYWGSRLAPLAWSLPPEQPSPLVWRRIRREIAGAGKHRASGARWSALAAAFALAAIVMGGGWWQSAIRPPVTVTETIIERGPEKASVAVVSNDDGAALWLVRILPDSRELTARVVTQPEAKADNDYQLWLIASDGTPLSLGLLPQRGDATLPIGAALVAMLDDSRMVAVSLEPSGGSPQATPTGPVLFTARLMAP